MTMPSFPSLLVFTLDPRGESSRRRLLPPKLERLSRRFLRESLDSTLRAGRSLGLRLEVATPRPIETETPVRQMPQPGASFGQRFRTAVSAAFRRASGPVIVVGSDVPGLRPRHLQSALSALGQDDDLVAVGPSPDGGFYLLAAHRPLDDALAEVTWCGARTRETLIRALERAGRRVVLLSPLRDIDHARDLAAWLATEESGQRRWRRLALLIRRTLADLARPLVDATLGRTLPGLAPAPISRGPPRF